MHFTINYHAFNPHPPSRKQQQQPSLHKKTQTHKKTTKNQNSNTKCKSNQTLRVHKCLNIAMILYHKCSFNYQDQAFHKNYMIRARPSSTPQQNHTPKTNKQTKTRKMDKTNAVVKHKTELSRTIQPITYFFQHRKANPQAQITIRICSK